MNNEYDVRMKSSATNFGKICSRAILTLLAFGAFLGWATTGSVLAQEPLELLFRIGPDLPGPFNLIDSEKTRMGQQNYAFVSRQKNRNHWFNEPAFMATHQFDPNADGRNRNHKYVIYGTSSVDPVYQSKVAAVKKAVKALVDRQVDTRILQLMAFNCSSDQDTTTQVVKRITIPGESFLPVTHFYLGPNDATPAGSVASNLNGQNGFDSYTIGILHMIGHVLYERDNSEGYYQGNILARTANRVSAYARTSRNEFVAEVFAGLMIGVNWPPEVIAEYNQQWVPRNPYIR
ncbi:MAG: hypothetical protein AB7Q37_08585 [Pyrinomonadaceae bacterium]